jgi:hypothetical protein
MRIVENQSGSLILEDHRGTQNNITLGVYSMITRYLPVEIAQESMNIQFPNFLPEYNVLYPQNDASDEEADYQFYEGHMRGLTVQETEEDL